MALAKGVFSSIENDDWLAVRDKMTEEARSALPKHLYLAQCESMVQKLGIPARIETSEVFLATFPKRKDASPAMASVQVKSVSLPNPVSLASRVGGHLAFVLGKATGQGAGIESWITLLMRRVDGDWRVAEVYMNQRAAAGHDGRWFIGRAVSLEKHGNVRAAFLYRELGCALQIPSPFIVVPAAARLLGQGLVGAPPANLPFPGRRPSGTWTLDNGTKVKVDYVGVVPAARFLGLEIRYQSREADPESLAARQERRLLYEYVQDRFPEYKDAFDSLYIGTVTPAGKGFRELFPLVADTGDSVPPSASGPVANP